MTKDEALDLALEALEHMLEDAKQERLTVEYWNECVDAITAIKQARLAPVQEPSGFFRHEDVCGDEVGHPTPYYLAPPAAPDLQAEIDATNRQVEILSDALAESRREVDAMIALARADEREACAKVCDELHWTWHMGDNSGPKECAAAIRARSCPPCNEDCDQGRNCPARKDK